MSKMLITKGDEGSAVEDVQRRLRLLGYGSDNRDWADGVFDDDVVAAVRAFREKEGLEAADFVDEATWAALVNATFSLGDRTLFLRMPYFHGCDVAELQTAMRALGFPCGKVDGIFGALTERAVREFQVNVGLVSDGIAGDSTFDAIRRLGHAWRDKDLLAVDRGRAGYARAAEVLEKNYICVFGTDEPSRAIASRVSNLALATTQASKVASADRLETRPDADTLLMHITFDSDTRSANMPFIAYEPDETFPRRLRTSIRSLAPSERRIVVCLPRSFLKAGDISDRDAQHLAVELLDAICSAYC